MSRDSEAYPATVRRISAKKVWVTIDGFRPKREPSVPDLAGPVPGLFIPLDGEEAQVFTRNREGLYVGPDKFVLELGRRFQIAI